MKQNALIIGVVLSLLISACGAQATPTVNPVDVQHTAEAAAFTMVAQTQAAIPTATPLPPTEPPTQTPLPTLTPLSSPTLDALNTTPVGLTITPQANIPTFTPQASGSGQDPCNQALTAWEGPSANINIVNETKPQGTLVLSLYVVTELGQCGYLYVTGDSITGPVGQYSAGAFVTGKKNFKVFGGFRITQGGWKIVVRNENIVALGGCYPKC
ncbi:MAG: hypothetical protein L0287_01920 [Anaerolineae bacterium]|nr:hypothetical protein [Anaerolineae bacterium]MCI0607543.1 hypothetical protein [Anaerolineae bacterium]